MKTRISFVANSSSSSFILLTPKNKTKTVLETIKISHENVADRTEIITDNYKDSLEYLSRKYEDGEFINCPGNDFIERIKKYENSENDVIIVEVAYEDEVAQEYVREFAIAYNYDGEWNEN